MKLTKKQAKAVSDWAAITGFELMHLDEVKSGEMTFQEAFSANVRWIESVAADASKVYKGEGL